jgi:DNA polymerase-4
MGITTIAALGAALPADLGAAFGGRMGPWLGARGRFEDDSPVSEERVAVSESRETTFPVDISDRAEQEAVLRQLSGELCDGLARGGRRGRTIAIKVRLDDFTTVTRARTIAAATCDGELVARLACELLAEYAPARPLRLLGVRVASFEAEAEAAAPQAGAGGPQLALPV